jgi:3-dehydroquinate synthetase
MGIGRRGLATEVAALLRRLGLPVRIENALPRDRVLAAMASDKKTRAARVRFALPRDIGTMFPGEKWTVAVEDRAITSALDSLRPPPDG